MPGNALSIRAEIVNVGDEINVESAEIRPASVPVSPPETALGEDPWVAIINVIRRYQTDRSRDQPDRLLAASLKSKKALKASIHVSEWTDQQNIHPSKVVNVGRRSGSDDLDIDEERRRISQG